MSSIGLAGPKISGTGPVVLPEEMTARTARLRQYLWERARENRKDDWLDKSLLPDLSKPLPGETELESVIVRRARGIAAVLAALTDPKQSMRTHSYSILPGELLVGVLPMGSNGLGKIFPDYLNEDERHMASLASRSEMSVQGHNAVDFQRLVDNGIGWVLEYCQRRINEIGVPETDRDEDMADFYKAVTISCQAVVDYATRFAELAAEQADNEPDPQRRAELLELEHICRKVPMHPADTFQEALQSILFLQIGLRAGMDLMSLGRLDQALERCLARTLDADPNGLARAVELAECLVIKLAGPLNLSVTDLVEQDHIDYGISMGTHKWYVDQRGNVNQFLQNVVIGGQNEHGDDATCDATHVLLQAWTNVNLPTPGLYVRLHKNSPQALLDQVATAIARTKAIPSILNDEVIIPGLYDSIFADGTVARMEAQELAYDYCVDGCWEPLLGGQSDWTFQMLNGMTVLECALNEGATLSSDPMLLRGNKLCYRTPPVRSYQDLQKALQTSMDFFVSQTSIAMFNYYLLDEFITPAPLFSAFLGTCLERGRDKTCGGARYAMAGTVLAGLPNMVNSIAAIKKWVFDENCYKMQDVLQALRSNFTSSDPQQQSLYSQIRKDFNLASPKFGSNDPVSNEIARMVADYFSESLKNAKRLADQVYRTRPRNRQEARRIQRLRIAGGYAGPTLEDRLSDEVTVAFTAGLGTFATYVLMGRGTAASADRQKDAPLAMNLTPNPSTLDRGVGHTLATLEALGLQHFPAGAPLDLCLDLPDYPLSEGAKYIGAVIAEFMDRGGSILSITLGNSSTYKTIYELACRSSQGDEAASEELLNWGHVMVRAGGWQTPFITMSLEQQKHYTEAVVDL